MPAVELISTGNELLIGRTLNSHAQTLAQYLIPIGLQLSRDTTIPDDPHVLIEAVKEALQRADVVVVSGGLGPTSDDITREAIALWLDRPIVLNKEAADNMLQKCEVRNITASQARLRQVLVVEGAEVWLNSVGAAPGERIAYDGKYILLLPGPPPEFKALLEDHVIPWLKSNFELPLPVAEQIFLLYGRGEGDVGALLEEHGIPPQGVDIAFCASPGGLEIRFNAASRDQLVPVADKVRAVLSDSIFAEDRLLMEEVTGSLLAEAKSTLATAESCTGGLLGHRITGVGGSSAYYLGGVVAYDNRIKQELLGVDAATLEQHGAVSEQVARQMAEGMRQKMGADYGIGITGIAGPTGGTPDKPVGLVYISLADKNETTVEKRIIKYDRDMVKFMSTQTALNMLRLRLIRNHEH